MTPYELYRYTRAYKTLGNLSRAYIDKIGDNWLVYANSSVFRRNVNTHVFLSKKEAILTRNYINGS